MPQLGESVTEGTIDKWLVAPGDTVTKYQPIAEVITDKVNAELPAPADGKIEALLVSAGETVKVGVLIARMSVEAGAGAAVGAGSPTVAAPGSPTIAAAGSPAVPGAGQAAGRFSPAVLRLAQEHGADLSRIKGSGLGGRITRKDVETHVAQAAQAIPTQGTAAPVFQAPRLVAQAPIPAESAPTAATAGGGPDGVQSHRPLTADQVVPVDAIRRRIAEKMVQSVREAPHAWTMMQVDVTGLVRLREQVGDEFRRREGVSLSYVPFFIKAVVESLREFPIINSQWAGDSIIIKKDINISIAVATETALAVPVIKNADRLSITGLNHAVADLAARARRGKMTMDDISGGTFTVNNTGYFGSFLSAPIINHPQAAILSFEVITKTPVVLEHDAIAIRSLMNMCMSLDHRILDGLVCGRFLQAVKGRLESYAPGTVSLV